jgi:type II secretory pathway predicted ATPase ExeA
MKTSNKIQSDARVLKTELKALWGATAWPFCANVKTPYGSESFVATLDELTQVLAVRASGLLCGPNGVGKSLLLNVLLDQLPAKTYRPILVNHSSLSPSDLIRHLCRIQGLPASVRRTDNALTLRNMWSELDPVWPVLVFEEAQNLSSPALEELRLLACDRTDTQTPFSLLLVGDDNLLARLRLGVNRPLLSRFGFCVQLCPWSLQDAQAYLLCRLREVSIATDVFDPQAEELLLQTAGGIPRIINHLAQRAFEQAAREHSRHIKPEHVQHALAQLPWLGKTIRK